MPASVSLTLTRLYETDRSREDFQLELSLFVFNDVVDTNRGQFSRSQVTKALGGFLGLTCLPAASWHASEFWGSKVSRVGSVKVSRGFIQPLTPLHSSQKYANTMPPCRNKSAKCECSIYLLQRWLFMSLTWNCVGSSASRWSWHFQKKIRRTNRGWT